MTVERGNGASLVAEGDCKPGLLPLSSFRLVFVALEVANELGDDAIRRNIFVADCLLANLHIGSDIEHCF